MRVISALSLVMAQKKATWTREFKILKITSKTQINTCLQNTKEDILKNKRKQTFSGPLKKKKFLIL